LWKTILQPIVPKGVRAKEAPEEIVDSLHEVGEAECTATNLTVGEAGEKKAGKGFAAAVTGYGNAVNQLSTGLAFKFEPGTMGDPAAGLCRPFVGGQAHRRRSLVDLTRRELGQGREAERLQALPAPQSQLGAHRIAQNGSGGLFGNG
jgi:hypothetical protein